MGEYYIHSFYGNDVHTLTVVPRLFLPNLCTQKQPRYEPKHITTESCFTTVILVVCYSLETECFTTVILVVCYSLETEDK